MRLRRMLNELHVSESITVVSIAEANYCDLHLQTDTPALWQVDENAASALLASLPQSDTMAP